MIIRITLKDPDGIWDSIHEAAQEQIDSIEGIEDDEGEALIEKRQSQISEKLKPWIEHGEYVRLEIDTEKQTTTVITNK